MNQGRIRHGRMSQGLTHSPDTHLGLRRHLAGWPLAALAVAFPLLAVALALPRAVHSEHVPLPLPDRAVIIREQAADRERAATVGTKALPFSVRLVGEWMRRYGSATFSDNPTRAAEARAELVSSVRNVLRSDPQTGQAELLRLRALQSDLFLSAVARWRGSHGRPRLDAQELDSDLRELGGEFVASCTSNGWLDENGRLRLSADQLFILYRVHWTELTGLLQRTPFRPGLEEFRLYYRLLLENADDEAHAPAARRLEYAQALAKLDPDYPGEVARGVLLLELNRPEAAFEAFQSFLKRRPDGPWVVRARNYALAALARIPEEE
ncbi:MAG TPA: tetratricopeptide repeat protein [Polyangiaceae bacterium]|nr:tetratricopeptide repeat protein [Polyangiaceae bacterium]